jgi:galactokinase
MPEVVRAPGRVNLIGGQVDYHEGLVVSLAVDRDVRVEVSPRDDGRIVARSEQLDGIVDIAADGSTDPEKVEPAWGRSIAAVTHLLHQLDRAPVGVELATSSSVPIGGGLSSSAAFNVALVIALSRWGHLRLTPNVIAKVAQQAEHIALGVPCGIQDPMTSVHGRAGHAVFLDCRSLEVEPIAIPPDLAVVVIHSGVERTLAGSPWSQRREESFADATQLGVDYLRDATAEQARDRPRARHVVSEIARVATFADALRRGDTEALGPLLLASHASSRDDMEVSIPELDFLVELLVEDGALGARLTGGGFGGCVVALTPADSGQATADRAAAAYASRTGRQPRAWVVQPADGANVHAGRT